jgi:hypothetical protein
MAPGERRDINSRRTRSSKSRTDLVRALRWGHARPTMRCLRKGQCSFNCGRNRRKGDGAGSGRAARWIRRRTRRSADGASSTGSCLSVRRSPPSGAGRCFPRSGQRVTSLFVDHPRKQICFMLYLLRCGGSCQVKELGGTALLYCLLETRQEWQLGSMALKGSDFRVQFTGSKFDKGRSRSRGDGLTIGKDEKSSGVIELLCPMRSKPVLQLLHKTVVPPGPMKGHSGED